MLESDLHFHAHLEQLATRNGVLAHETFTGKAINPVCKIVQSVVSGGDKRIVFPTEYENVVGSSGTDMTCHMRTQIMIHDEGKTFLYTGSLALEACTVLIYKYVCQGLDRMRNFLAQHPFQLCATISSGRHDLVLAIVTAKV